MRLSLELKIDLFKNREKHSAIYLKILPYYKLHLYGIVKYFQDKMKALLYKPTLKMIFGILATCKDTKYHFLYGLFYIT